ncbi:hypothetical protein TNCV_2845451 [Trichonephila clavipes]|nr:hypothetical protein TNCV_2845451 [Trichonephila clavipes]
MIGKLEEGRTVTSVAAEFEINKRVSFRALGKRSKPQVQLLERLVVAARGRQTAGNDLYIILQAKSGRQQSASVIAQQLSTATGRQVSRFTVARRLHKGAYSPTVLNVASRLKLTTDATVYSGAESTKTGQMINGVVSSLRMRVSSVPEAIPNAF